MNTPLTNFFRPLLPRVEEILTNPGLAQQVNPIAFPHINTPQQTININIDSQHIQPHNIFENKAQFKHIMTNLLSNDHGLGAGQKQSLFTVLNTPEVFDHLLVGTVGAALTHVVAKYMDIPKPARTLLSLAGFGIGNIIYNTLQTNKFTNYDPDRAVSTIKL